MLAEFEKKIADFFEENSLFGSADKVLLAVSGGADSTALLYAMHTLKAEGIFAAELICAHINHQLRAAESDTDEDFVVAEANKLNLKLITKRVDVRRFARKNKLSIETAARQLRIESLCDIAANNNCRWIATAHHANDNAETILQRLARGTGFRGLGGIRPVRKFGQVSFVRPLLYLKRDEIIEYLRQRNLKWQTDRTNRDCKYRRNFIRHRLIPQLQQQCSNSLVEQLSRLARSARKFDSLIRSCADKLWPKITKCDNYIVKLDLEEFNCQHPEVKIELVRRSLTYVGSGQRDLIRQHFEKVLELAERNVSGKKIELPGGFIACREYGDLVFRQSVTSQMVSIEAISINVPGETEFGGYLVKADVFDAERERFEKLKVEKDKFIESLDLEKVKPPLEIRFRRAADRFWPLGFAGSKRVGKFLTTAKVPQEIREKIVIISDSEGIIWVWPTRISEEVKVTEGTRKVLQLRINLASGVNQIRR